MNSFNTRFNQLITLDKTRLGTFIEIFQYSIICTFMASYTAYYTNEYLLSDTNNYDTLFKTILMLSIELAIITIIVFYLRKITLLIPSVASFIFNHFEPYTTIELTIWIVLVFVFIGNMDKLKNKLSIIKDKLNNKKK